MCIESTSIYQINWPECSPWPRWGGGTVEARAPDQSPEVAEAYREWVMGGVGSEGARALFHTRYHDRGAEAAAAAGGTVAIAAQLKLTSDW